MGCNCGTCRCTQQMHPAAAVPAAEPATAITIHLQESNLKHSINGFMYCNMPGLEARLGQRVRWCFVESNATRHWAS